jgi:hypothetical protein
MNLVWSILLPDIFSVLSSPHHCLQSHQSLAEHLTLFCKGNVLLHRLPESEELAHFIEGSTEAGG